MKQKIVLKIPTPALIREYNKKFEKDERYFLADQAIIELFEKFPNNTDVKHILLKLSVINDLYSTNIFATFEMAKHILSLNVDNDIIKGTPEIVNRIANITISGKNKNFYSFATKYCNWHNQEKYTIYDSFVDKILRAYRDQTNFDNFANENLRDYKKFKVILTKFRQCFKLHEFDFKYLDKFLWIYGKEIYKR